MNAELANPYHALTRRFAWGLLAPPVLGGLVALQELAAGVAVGVLALVVVLFAIGVSAFVAATLEGELQALREGKALARWPVSGARVAGLWQDWRRQARVAALATLGVLGGASATTAGIFYVDENAPGIAAGVLALGLALGVPLAIGVYFLVRGEPPGERTTLYLRPALAVIGGRILRWQGAGFTLQGVEAGEDADGAVLAVHFHVSSKYGPVEHRLRLPAPSREEAERVAAEIGALVSSLGAPAVP